MPVENFWMPKKAKQYIQSEMGESLLEVLGEEPEEKSHDENEHENIVPKGLRPTCSIADSHEQKQELYGWYAEAIQRRGREPLNKERFAELVFGGNNENSDYETSYAFGERDTGYLLGILRQGIFVPTHFAPKSIRGGYEIIKKLGESSEIPAVLSITEDLRRTIEKLDCWKVLGMNYLSSFHSKLVQKEIVYNSYPNIEPRLTDIVRGYLERAETLAKDNIAA